MTAYENVKRTSDLYLSYWNNLKNSSIWKKFCDNLKELYKNSLEEFCFWNIEKDADRIIDRINLEAQQVIINNSNRKIGFDGNEMDYGVSTSVSNCIVDFKIKLESFVTQKVPDIIVEELKVKEKLYFPNKYAGK